MDQGAHVGAPVIDFRPTRRRMLRSGSCSAANCPPCCPSRPGQCGKLARDPSQVVVARTQVTKPMSRARLPRVAKRVPGAANRAAGPGVAGPGFEMQMRARRIAGHADTADALARLDALANLE